MKTLLLFAGVTLSCVAAANAQNATVGGGTVAEGAFGPQIVLVKNWDFGARDTIRNTADMSANFFYHDQFGTINNGGNYGSNTVAPDAANALDGQPIEGVNSAKVREFTPIRC